MTIELAYASDRREVVLIFRSLRELKTSFLGISPQLTLGGFMLTLATRAGADYEISEHHFGFTYFHRFVHHLVTATTCDQVGHRHNLRRHCRYDGR